jgi:YfiR/HmsC-like
VSSGVTRRRAWALLALVLTALPVLAVAEDISLEYRVKAAYLYKVAPFVSWPQSALGGPGRPFILCVQGSDPFGSELDRAVAGQGVAGHPFVVRRLETVSADSGCLILFAGGSRRQSVADALHAVRGTNVLTVTDGERPDAPRGVIHFVISEGRVRFDIDTQAARENGLEVSAKLLVLAHDVRPRR